MPLTLRDVMPNGRERRKSNPARMLSRPLRAGWTLEPVPADFVDALGLCAVRHNDWCPDRPRRRVSVLRDGRVGQSPVA